MQNEKLCPRFFANPIVAAVRNVRDLEDSLQSNVSAVFLLTGTLLNIKQLVLQCKGKKYVFLHADLIEGLSNDIWAMRYLAEVVQPDRIISTRSSVIKHGKEVGLYTIQRYFCMDSLALHTGIKAMGKPIPMLWNCCRESFRGWWNM